MKKILLFPFVVIKIVFLDAFDFIKSMVVGTFTLLRVIFSWNRGGKDYLKNKRRSNGVYFEADNQRRQEQFKRNIEILQSMNKRDS